MFVIASHTSAQNIAITETTIMYRKSVQLGGNLNSTGIFGLNFRYGWHKTAKKQGIFDFEIARIKDPKEYKIYGASDNPQRYSYGRLNMAFFLRTGVGRSIKLTERPYKNALGININYAVGISTAMLKPIYLDIYHPYTDRSGGYVEAERYDPDIHNNPSLIFGNANFFTGINKSTFTPGGYARISLSAEWGQYNEEFHNLEGGLTFDFFPTALPLMAFSPERTQFLVLYIAYIYGFNK